METKKRVLFLLHLPPPIHGSSVVGNNIKNSLIINDKFDCSFINLLASKQVSDSGKLNLSKIVGYFTVIKLLLINIIKKKPIICYFALTAVGKAFYKDLIIVCILKFFKIKIIYHLHNKGIREKEKSFVNRICYHLAFNNTKVIILSESLYNDIESFVSRDNVYICPNGIADECLLYKDTDLNNELIYASKNPDFFITKPVQLLFLSNLSKAKGIFVLLEACRLLKNRNISFTCAVVGSEGDVTATEFEMKLKELKLSIYVNYFGKRYGIDKYRAFSESDVFVFPTYFETFGLVNLEAMQQCLPIVSTYEGGIPDIIEDNVTGFLVPKKDPVALSNKLEILIKDPLLRKTMGKAGREKYEAVYTIEKFQQRLISILEDSIK